MIEGSPMPRPLKLERAPRRRRSAVLLLAGVAGFALAALAAVALAATHTLNVAKNAKVVNFNTHAVTHENIVVNSRGRAMYTLSGDSKANPKCTSSACLAIWPPLKVKSTKHLSKATGIKGKLGTWHHQGFLQVTLGGHPLYKFFQDGPNHVANGEAIHSFKGTWHVIKVNLPAGSTTMGTTTTSMSTTTSSCVPSPGYPC
jgi:predicted lipoprotein with Yx(FWY)xxD motif